MFESPHKISVAGRPTNSDGNITGYPGTQNSHDGADGGARTPRGTISEKLKSRAPLART